MSGNRLSASVCEDVALNVQFYCNGEAADPLALCSISIYRCSVSDENLVTEIVLPAPTLEDYDLSNEFIYRGLIQRCGNQVPDSLCGTGLPPKFTPGCYIFNLNLCQDLFGPGVYYDVWNFVGSYCPPCDITEVTNVTDITGGIDPADLCMDENSNIQSQCNKFMVNGSCWAVDDGLKNIRLGFEPLDSRFQQPEVRILEVGMMPLPLYDYDFAKMNRILPALNATITITTSHCCEVIVDAEPMKVGLRQGSYRSNPYTLQYLLDTKRFLKGTYRGRVDVALPDGQVRSSPLFNIAIR